MDTPQTKPEIAKTIIVNIINMQIDILAQSSYYSASDLWQLNFEELFKIHDRLVREVKRSLLTPINKK